MASQSSPVFTVGYQEATQAAVLQALTEAGVELLVDVRAVPASRRAGFSKRQLAAGLQSAGIEYLHLRELGTPAEGREAARKGRHDVMRRIYEAHLENAEAQLELAALQDLLRSGRRLCLLCFERRPEHCHRSLILEHLRDLESLEVHHLMPEQPLP
jgi:uncharacterized protein (DUF488 family)